MKVRYPSLLGIVALALAASAQVVLASPAQSVYWVNRSGRVCQTSKGCTTALTGANTQVAALATTHAGVYMLASNDGDPSQVWHYTGTPGIWTRLTGDNTSIATFVVAGNAVYIVANNGGPNQVWHYTGTPGIWTPITGDNTKVASISVAKGSLYMVGNNGGCNQVWRYTGTPCVWTVCG